MLDPNEEINVKRNLQLALIAMSFGFFDFVEEIFNQPLIRLECAKQGCFQPMHDVSNISKLTGKNESKAAFVRHLREFGNFIRKASSLIFP